MAKATVLHESRVGVRNRTAYWGKVRRALLSMGRSKESVDSEMDRSADYIERGKRGGIDPKMVAAVVDASLHHVHPTPTHKTELRESATREEWEVLVRGVDSKTRDAIAAMYPGRTEKIGSSAIVVRDFYDDDKAAGVARAVTKKYGSMVTYGPRAQIAAECSAMGGSDRSATGEGGQYEARDSGGPFTQIHRDPERFAVVKERADAIGPLKDDRSLYELLVPDLEKETQEVFYVVTVDLHGQLLQYAEVARGQVDRVAISNREIFPVVLLDKASGFAIAHNHPSGAARPSDADKALTDQVRKAAKVVCPEVAFLDHLVVTRGEYYSFTARKLVKVR